MKPRLSEARLRRPRRQAGAARKRAALAWVLGCVVTGLGGPAAAQQTELANECCLTMLRPTGARSLSLGGAITARPSPDGLFANPGLLGPIADDVFLVHNASTTIEDSNTFTLLIASSVGTFALSYRLNDFGETETRSDVPGSPAQGSIALFEHTLVATYATTVAGGLSAGLSYNLFQFRLDCRGFCGTESFAATTHMLDVGAHWRPPAIPGLNLGASIVHVGFPLQVINEQQASPSPARLRIGGAYEILQHTRADSVARLWLSVDVVNRARTPGAPIVNVGADLSLDETLFLRAGYGGAAGTLGGAGIGVGLRYDRFDLAVAKSFVSSALEEGDPFQVTFGIRF